MLWDDGAIKNEVLPGCAAELPIGGPKTHTFIADLYNGRHANAIVMNQIATLF